MVKRFLSAVTAVFLLFGCGPGINEAIVYNEAIVLQYDRIASLEERIVFLIISEDTAYFDSELAKYRLQLDKSDSIVRALGPLGDYSDFNAAALKMFEVYRDATPRIEELMGIVRHKANYEAPDGIPYDTLVSHKLFYMDSILGAEFDTFYMAQEKFAARFSFRLE